MSLRPSDKVIDFILKGFEHINGTIDWERFAADNNASSPEAAREVFEKFFAYMKLNVGLNGNNIAGGGSDPATETKLLEQLASRDIKPGTAEEAIIAENPKYAVLQESIVSDILIRKPPNTE